jgi:hypothetical protein
VHRQKQYRRRGGAASGLGAVGINFISNLFSFSEKKKKKKKKKKKIKKKKTQIKN